jgi:hypothetical protein
VQQDALDCLQRPALFDLRIHLGQRSFPFDHPKQAEQIEQVRERVFQTPVERENAAG